MRHMGSGVGLTFVLLCAPASPADVINGFDSNWLLVLRSAPSGAGYPDGEIRKLDETGANPHSNDLGSFGTVAFGTFPLALPPDDPKSLCFSNSPLPGKNSPAGARLFGVYSIRGSGLWTSSFRIVEFNAAGKKIREAQIGLATGNTDPDSILAVNDPNNTDGARIGAIRYNPARNTLAVACNVADYTIASFGNPPKGRVYEFELPDWPEVYSDPPANTKPVPVSDPDLVKLVQIYEMPNPHSISGGNGNIRNGRPAIDFDDAGNMYFTSAFFSAKTGPIWTGSKYVGDGLWWGDVVKFSTLGHHDGKNILVLPLTGPGAAKIVIQSDYEQVMLGHTTLGSGWGIAVRPTANQLVLIPESACSGKYIHLYDLTETVGGNHPDELKFIKILNIDVYNIPRQGAFAQRDYTSGKIYIGNREGGCDNPFPPGQNFMWLNNDSPADNTTRDVGYTLTVLNPAGYPAAGSLSRTWDAASPPAAPTDPTGACCLPGQGCREITRSACAAASGIFQDGGTTCGQFACPVVCSIPAVDADGDGDVDQDDFGAFQLCYTGPGGPLPADPGNCKCFDQGTDVYAGDHAVDKFDYDRFQECATGPDIAADPCCAGGPGCP